ncbi:phage tail tape measure protein, partial [Pseudomonas sp. MWU13-2625]
LGKEGKFARSNQLEYQTRSNTTANALQLMQNNLTRMGNNNCHVLLPPLNDVLTTIGPLISQVSALAAEHPEVIKGVLGAGIAFGVLRLAVLASTIAMKVFGAVTSISPVGLIVRGIALAAGLLIANWSTVGPYFQALWEKIKGPAMVLWGWFKQAVAFTPLGLVIENWGPLTEFFKAIWGVLVAISGPAWDLIKHMFDWSPLGIIIQNWEPITAWFKGLWEKIKPIIEPILR